MVAVGAALAGKCGVEPRARLILAVSGGADSFALLAAMAALATRPHLEYELVVAHVHHGRRAGADEEAAGVRAAAAEFALPYEQVDLDPGAAVEPGGLAAHLRRARYEALGRIAREHGADAIATAHQGTDQLETLLLALARGAGLDGLSGMAWRAERFGATIVRPLLGVGREECRALLESIGWAWFDDPTNESVEHPRIRVRQEVLPALRAIAPDLDGRITRTTDQLADAAALVEGEARRLFGDEAGAGSHDRETLRGASAIIVGAGLRRAATALGAPIDQVSAKVVGSTVEAIGDAVRRPRRFEWPGGVVVRVTAKTVEIGRADEIDGE
ncbi:MAG: tRNA lysidine(34) synthetase TilS [Phycisphaerales bacterium]